MASEQALLEALEAIVGVERVVRNEADKASFLSDWRGRYRGNALAVVLPADTPQVAAVVAACSEAGVPIVPQGGNTGLCGGATPLPEARGVVLNLSRLNRVRTIDAANNALVVEAGCTLAAVQEAAERIDRFFPLSLAAEGSCQIGGNVSTNAGGVQVLRYGNTRELVLGLEVVLPDGRVWDGLRTLRKDNTGYDLKQLFIGAEGTLGVVTAVALKLFHRPRSSATAWVAIPDPDAAVALLSALRTHCGDRVTAFEIVGKTALDLVLKHMPGARAPLQDESTWSVLIELTDTVDDAGLEGMLEAELGKAFESGLALDAALAGNLAQAEALWGLRENISESERHEGISIKHDISVPVSRIPDFLRRADEALLARWPETRIVAFGHIGDGNLHYNLSKTEKQDNDSFIARTPEVNRIVHDLVHELGGSISAEHGLGQLKREEVKRYKSEVELELMRAIKRSLDPHGLMNPGKVV